MVHKAYAWSPTTGRWVSTMCHPHMLTQDPERLLQGELEELETEADQDPSEDASVSEPATVQAPA